MTTSTMYFLVVFFGLLITGIIYKLVTGINEAKRQEERRKIFNKINGIEENDNLYLKNIIMDSPYLFEYEDEKNRLQSYLNDNNLNEEAAYEPQVDDNLSVESQVIKYLGGSESFTMEESIEFNEKLNLYLNKSNVSKGELLKSCGLSKKTIKKIEGAKNYVPRKNTVILIILNLKLSLEKANELMSLALYEFDEDDGFDSYILRCIKNEYYNVLEINKSLYEEYKRII